MIVIILALIGGYIGQRNAAKRGGNRLDRAQYGVVYGIVFGLIGLFVTVLVERVL
ncbi:apolipoprotein acyltransferase [Candidatus Halocynthiibacter alkanivorans]|jgi:tetrahydromethanopterin S-methyltransferase subunit G|uniref:apolipoprotein acyltransferase n=1 Tax=Candidatus Halocynthiibacter alkanivorans TaxID=2267619 RepID=UPI000DF3355F|nr:apolipoprotein acyltransferase [Candidatus Halocynthiibacter alkanivorans]